MVTEQNNWQGQVGFRSNRSCVHHVYMLGMISQGKEDARVTTCRFFLVIQKAYDTAVWTNGWWKELWETRISENMKMMTECARRAVMLGGD